MAIDSFRQDGCFRRFPRGLSIAALLATVSALPAVAQPAAPPVYMEVDKNGVELRTGQLTLALAGVAIGSGPGDLSYNQATNQPAQTDARGYVLEDNSVNLLKTFSVIIGAATETFEVRGTLGVAPFTQKQGRGSTLVYDIGSQVYTYTGADGTVATFSKVIPGGSFPSSYPHILSLTHPAGEVITYFYRNDNVSPNSTFGLKAITSSLGYQLRLTGTINSTGQYNVWRAEAFSSRDETCEPSAESCTLSGSWPAFDTVFSGTQPDGSFTWTFTDSTGKQMIYARNAAGQIVIRYPSGRTVTYTLTNGRVTSVNDGRGTWQYEYPTPVGVATIVKAPGEVTGRAYSYRTSDGRVQVDTLASQGTTAPASYEYDAQSRISSVTRDGRRIEYSYDGRGNVTLTRFKSKTPGTPPDVTTSAEYASVCVNLKTCNKPTYTIDALGERTDYTYDPNHGGVLTITRPPAPSGVRAQRRFTYAQLQANYKSGSGALVQGAGAYRLTGISECRSTVACAGTSDETTVSLSYNPDAGLLPSTVTKGAGDGTLSVTTSNSYTGTGQIKLADGPIPGVEDAVRTYYDAMGRVIGKVGPDPDGAGPLPRQATRTSYDADGNVLLVENGTTPDQNDLSMSNFAPVQQFATEFDGQGRPVKLRLISGGITSLLEQTSYTDAGRTECVTTRMNPAVFSAPLVSACTLTTAGPFGPDRITRTSYDPAGRVNKVQTGYGLTTEQTDEISYTYTATGKTESLSDANANKTSFVYDGHDRLVITKYPSPSVAGVSSETDYEELGYDPAGNIVSQRRRDGRKFSYNYDRLGQLISKIVPDACVGGYVCVQPPLSATRDVYYGYDLQGRPTYARFDSDSGGDLVLSAYDALGRLTSSTTQMDGQARSTGYSYASDDTLIRLTYPDGNWVRYQRDILGRLAAADVNGTLPLFRYDYDGSGHAVALSRWNGALWSAPTTFTYDPASRLTSITDKFMPGTPAATTTLGYNPAGQVATLQRDHSGYAFSGYLSVNRPYVSNGLNQYSSAGSVAFSYDSAGNLISSGASQYAYDAENRLIGTSAGATLRYDPLGRLYETNSPSTGATRFAYDASDILAEFNSSGDLLRRYVHGDDADNPLIWFEGADFVTSRHLYTDHLGSVTAITNSAGSILNINSYDQYGVPSSSNIGRFQYTGQVWLPELGMYYYKARVYSPTLGRFLQTDPLGYSDGMNLYRYVGNDPINGTDPTGMCQNQVQLYLTHAVYSGTTGALDRSQSFSIPLSPFCFDTVGESAFNYQRISGAVVPQIGNPSGQQAKSAKVYRVSIRVTGRTWMNSHVWIEWQRRGGKLRSVGLNPHKHGSQEPGIQFNVELDSKLYPARATRTVDITQQQFAKMAKYIVAQRAEDLQWSETCTCAHFAEKAWLEATGEEFATWFRYEDPNAVADAIDRFNAGKGQ